MLLTILLIVLLATVFHTELEFGHLAQLLEVIRLSPNTILVGILDRKKLVAENSVG